MSSNNFGTIPESMTFFIGAKSKLTNEKRFRKENKGKDEFFTILVIGKKPSNANNAFELNGFVIRVDHFDIFCQYVFVSIC